eukprot:6186671-Pleurochrysis_carterae.AAC.1
MHSSGVRASVHAPLVSERIHGALQILAALEAIPAIVPHANILLVVWAALWTPKGSGSLDSQKQAYLHNSAAACLQNILLGLHAAPFLRYAAPFLRYAAPFLRYAAPFLRC